MPMWLTLLVFIGGPLLLIVGPATVLLFVDLD